MHGPIYLTKTWSWENILDTHTHVLMTLKRGFEFRKEAPLTGLLSLGLVEALSLLGQQHHPDVGQDTTLCNDHLN